MVPNDWDQYYHLEHCQQKWQSHCAQVIYIYNYSHHLSPSKPGGNLFTQKYDSFNSEGYNLALWTTLEVYFNLVLMEPLYENIISLIVIASSSECIVFLKPLQHLAVILVCLVQRF